MAGGGGVWVRDVHETIAPGGSSLCAQVSTMLTVAFPSASHMDRTPGEHALRRRPHAVRTMQVFSIIVQTVWGTWAVLYLSEGGWIADRLLMRGMASGSRVPRTVGRLACVWGCLCALRSVAYRV